jgi:hypothetical protein
MPTWTALTTCPRNRAPKPWARRWRPFAGTRGCRCLRAGGRIGPVGGRRLFHRGARRYRPVASGGGAWGAALRRVRTARDRLGRPCPAGACIPVEAGRFYLYGSHDAENVPPGRVPLLIEAAMAFGTGHHGTTKGCLEAFDRLLSQGVVPQKVADIGAGTAVLAIAAAKTIAEPGHRVRHRPGRGGGRRGQRRGPTASPVAAALHRGGGLRPSRPCRRRAL